MMNVRVLPGCYLFAISLFLGLCANRSFTISQSDLPPLPDRLAANPRGISDAQRSIGQSPGDLQNPGLPSQFPSGQFPSGQSLGVHVVGASTSCATATHLMTSATLSNGQQQLVIIDPAKLTLAVYHIEPSRGDIQLRSVRKIDADFSLEEFNLSEPTPSTIRRNARAPIGR